MIRLTSATDRATGPARLVEGYHVIEDSVHGALFVWNVRHNSRYAHFETIPAEQYVGVSYEVAVQLPRQHHFASLNTPVRFA